MRNGRITLHDRVGSALDVLTPAERKAIRAKIAELGALPVEQWPRRGAIRISPDEPLYMASVDDSLRIILRADEGAQPEVQYLVRHETLEMFRTAGNPTRS
jgi:hypothetical protein